MAVLFVDCLYGAQPGYHANRDAAEQYYHDIPVSKYIKVTSRAFEDRDGQIDMSDLRQPVGKDKCCSCCLQKPQCTAEKTQEMINDSDSPADGTVDYDDFRRIMLQELTLCF